MPEGVKSYVQDMPSTGVCSSAGLAPMGRAAKDSFTIFMQAFGYKLAWFVCDLPQ
jgi:hypothetical protein